MHAGLCEDPKDYRWCGYAEAVGGSGCGRKLSRAALEWLVALPADGGERSQTEIKSAEALRRWRCWLFGLPSEEGAQAQEQAVASLSGEARTFQRRISKKKTLEVLAGGGRLTRADYLRCRVRYFTDGG